MGTCSKVGALEYDTTNSVFKTCDGSNWIRNKKSECVLSAANFSVVHTVSNSTYLDGPANLVRSADNNTLFVVSWNNVTSWNKSSMPNISTTRLGTVTSTDFQNLAGAVRVGDYLYVATQKLNGVAVVNISNPSSMTYNSSHKVTNATEMDNLSALVADPNGQYLYTISHNSGSACWFHVISISSPTAPAIVGKVNVTSSTGSIWCSNLEWVKDNTLVFSYASGIGTISVATKTAPTVLDYGGNASSIQAAGLAISPDGNSAYTVSQDGNNRLCSWNISNPSNIPNPTCYQHSTYTPGYFAEVVGKYLFYTSEGGDTFGAIPLASLNSTPMTLTSSTQLKGATEILFEGRYAIVGAYGGTNLAVVDMGCDPSNSAPSLGACSVAGRMEYDSASKKLKWCDGSDWYSITD